MPTHYTINATNIEATCANTITSQILEMHKEVIKELRQINAALNRLAPATEAPVQTETETLPQPIPLREPKQIKSRRA